jgi:predicted nucleic acid-binding protein
LAATTDPEQRAKLQQILPLVTAGIVFNSFRFDRGAWGDENDSDRIDHLRAGRMDGTHTNNALLAHTALRDGAALVTADKSLINRIRRLDPAPEVLHPRDLLTEIGYVALAP